MTTNTNTPNCSLEEAVEMVVHYGVTSASFNRVSFSTGWKQGKLEAAYDRYYMSWAADQGYDI